MEAKGERPSAFDDQKRLLESAERVAQVGSWEWIPETDELRFSDNLFRLFGLESGSATPSTDLLVELTHPDDRERQIRELERVRGGARHQRFDYRVVHRDGAIRHMRSTLVEFEEKGSSGRVLGTVQDVTDQREVGTQMAAHVAVSEALGEWESFETGAATLLRKLAEAMDCVTGALWVRSRDKLVARVLWSVPRLDIADFEAATARLRLARGEGLPGSVWQTGVPIVVNTEGHRGYIRLFEATKAGLRGAIAFPVISGEDTPAVVELYSHEDAKQSEHLVRCLVGIGHELGHFLERRQGGPGRRSLTPRELEVLQLVAEGHSRAKIAALLTISPATVKSHLEHVYGKLEVSNRAQAVATAVRAGLIH
jgi:PAS domain S-box-containing protein